MSGDRGQETEARCQETEVRGQEAVRGSNSKGPIFFDYKSGLLIGPYALLCAGYKIELVPVLLKFIVGNLTVN